MKPSTFKFAAVALTSLLSAGVFSAPRSADACSPPQEGIFASGGVEFAQTIPTNGAWAFRAYVQGDDLDNLSIEVRDENDALVAGSVSNVVINEYSYEYFSAASENLVVWTPAEALLPEHTYSVSVSAPHPYAEDHLFLDEQTTFETAASPQANLEVATVEGSPSIQITENQGNFECCETSTFCDSCGDCTQCWATSYVYQPTIDIEVNLPTTDTDLQTYHRVEASSGTYNLYWNNRNTEALNFLFEDGAPGPYCVTVQTFALATQELLDETETCFEQSELPSYTERELEGVTRPEQCEDAPDVIEEPDTTTQPDTGETPDTTDGPDTGGPDAGPQPPQIGADTDTGCGCSSTPNAPTSLFGILLFFAALGASRRSIFSGRN